MEKVSDCPGTAHTFALPILFNIVIANATQVCIIIDF